MSDVILRNLSTFKSTNRLDAPRCNEKDAKEVLVKKRNLRKLKSIHVLFPKEKATNSKITFIVLLVKFVKDCMYHYFMLHMSYLQSSQQTRADVLQVCAHDILYVHNMNLRSINVLSTEKQVKEV